ncbi:MAG: TlpA family protein disulfide reductase [Bacteroidetes bacterium]|nr:MAG: TlpA family protein disulfide reductase [Bacteroidota bacterium]
MKKIFFLIALFFAFDLSAQSLKTGFWRAVLQTQAQELPFMVEVVHANKVLIINGKEQFACEQIRYDQDSVHIDLGHFDGELVAKISDQKMQGYWVRFNTSQPYQVPFFMEFGKKNRFESLKKAETDFSGTWEVEFVSDQGVAKKVVGIFEQKNEYLTGTFLTPTGDYRFLEGKTEAKSMAMSSFNGGDAYLFQADLQTDNSIKGQYWSGKSYHATWTARRNEQAKLPDANTMTFLKEGYKTLDFAFPNLEGKTIQLTDEKFKNKVVIVQLFGSWCPNCMDETAFLAPFYKKNKSKGLEIVALAYENYDNLAQAKPRIEKIVKRFEVGYEILFAGKKDKEVANKTLPALNAILSFPTTIVIDKKGLVRQIHTGFSGAATGKYYLAWIEEFESLISKLLKE